MAPSDAADSADARVRREFPVTSPRTLSGNIGFDSAFGDHTAPRILTETRYPLPIRWAAYRGISGTDPGLHGRWTDSGGAFQGQFSGLSDTISAPQLVTSESSKSLRD